MEGRFWGRWGRMEGLGGAGTREVEVGVRFLGKTYFVSYVWRLRFDGRSRFCWVVRFR